MLNIFKIHKNKSKYIDLTISVSLFLGVILLSMNIYGLFIDIRKENLHLVDQQLLRFNNDQYLTYEESLEKLKEIYSNNDIEYALEANKLVQ